MKLVGILLLVITSTSVAREVIDLGRIKVKGAARGPQMHFIESMRPKGKVVGRLMLEQIKDFEKELLKPKMPDGKFIQMKQVRVAE